MASTSPVLAPARSPAARPGALVAFVAVLAVVYAGCSTWSIARGFGGVDSDNHWVDDAGRPTSRPPLTADVTGHPSEIVLAALLLGTAVALVLARRASTPATANRVLAIAAVAATVLVVAAWLVLTVLQMRLVDDAFAAGNAHPVLLGGARLVVSRMTFG